MCGRASWRGCSHFLIAMKNVLFFLLPFFLLLMFPACSELSLEEEIEADDDDKEKWEAFGDTVRVKELSDVEEGSEVVLKAYVVGYISGSSMSGAVFGLPQEANTNVLVADSLHPSNYKYCAPVQLAANSEWRTQLNLCEYPEWLGAYVAIRGTCSTYFRVAGIKKLESVERLADVPADSTETDTPDREGLALPTLSDGPAQVFEGA